MKSKKIASAAIGACLALSLTPAVAFAADFQDTEGHWAEAAIDRWGDSGVVNGVAPGVFEPDSDMTRAEAAQVFANLLKLDGAANLDQFTDIEDGAWYVDALSACVDAGIMQGIAEDTMDPAGTISREMLFVMFARAIDLPAADTLNVEFTDADAISDWAQGAVYALVNAGYVQGVGDGIIAPNEDINRASVLALLNQTISSYVVANGETAVTGEGIVLVVADEVALTGTAGADVVVAAENASIDMAGLTGDVTVTVIADNVAIEGAAEGTVVAVAEGVEGTTVNDVAVTAGEDYVVPAEEADEPTPAPDPNPNPEPGTDPDEPGTDPDEPGTDPDEPGTDPDEPGTDPDEPGTDPDEPGTDPDEPGDPNEPDESERPGSDVEGEGGSQDVA